MVSAGFFVWFPDLPCSGKSAQAGLLDEELSRRGLRKEILDGDEIRKRLTKGLGFSKKNQDENFQRIAYVAKPKP